MLQAKSGEDVESGWLRSGDGKCVINVVVLIRDFPFGFSPTTGMGLIYDLGKPYFTSIKYSGPPASGMVICHWPLAICGAAEETGDHDPVRRFVRDISVNPAEASGQNNVRLPLAPAGRDTLRTGLELFSN